MRAPNGYDVRKLRLVRLGKRQPSSVCRGNKDSARAELDVIQINSTDNDFVAVDFSANNFARACSHFHSVRLAQVSKSETPRALKSSLFTTNEPNSARLRRHSLYSLQFVVCDTVVASSHATKLGLLRHFHSCLLLVSALDLQSQLNTYPKLAFAMAPSLLERLQARIEIFRLEQRYTRRRNRRSTFQSNAIYVNGEYIYQTPNSTGSSTGTGSGNSSDGPRVDALHEEEPAYTESTKVKEPRKRLSRFASMPGFGNAKTSEYRTRRTSEER